MYINRFLPFALLTVIIAFAFRPKEGNIRFEPVRLTEKDKALLSEVLKEYHPKYDEKGNMLTNTLTGYNYHTDATVGEFHDVRRSLLYALALLDLGDKSYEKRAFATVEQTISLQDQDPNSKTAGIWPYYKEEPLATKKSPPDFNWADFNGESLLDIWMGHQKKIPEALKPKIRESLIFAAKSIVKRNMGPGYTNIAIKGTYVTYLVSHLFNLQDMQVYARKRLQTFYNYTLEKGFTEYNSPTYTIEALDDLIRMQKHIVQPEDRKMIDSIYNLGWRMIARHFHQPTGQWAGPHSRSYASMLRSQVNGILKQASGGQIKTGPETYRLDVKIKHNIPTHLAGYFLSPKYPRVEIDTFIRDEPATIGTCFLTKEFALSTANRSSMWNQRRPFLAYWGNG